MSYQFNPNAPSTAPGNRVTKRNTVQDEDYVLMMDGDGIPFVAYKSLVGAVESPTLYDDLVADPDCHLLWYPDRAGILNFKVKALSFTGWSSVYTKNWVAGRHIQDGVMALGGPVGASIINARSFTNNTLPNYFKNRLSGLWENGSIIICYVPSAAAFPTADADLMSVGFGYSVTATDVFISIVAGGNTQSSAESLSAFKALLVDGWNVICIQAYQEAIDSTYMRREVHVNGVEFVNNLLTSWTIASMTTPPSGTSGGSFAGSSTLMPAMYCHLNRHITVEEQLSIFDHFKTDHNIT